MFVITPVLIENIQNGGIGLNVLDCGISSWGLIIPIRMIS